MNRSERSLGFLFVLWTVAPLAMAAGEERRLDPLLRPLFESQRGSSSTGGAPLLDGTQASDVLDRVRGVSGAVREGNAAAGLSLRSANRLRLLVKYSGDSVGLETVGFRVESQVGLVYAGTLDPSRLTDLMAVPAVLYVQLSHDLKPTLRPPNSALGGTASLRPLLRLPAQQSADSGASAAGALIGYVDTGVDIFHQDFRTAGGQTRIKYLLDLSNPGDTNGDGVLDGSGPYGGTLYTEADINAALIAGSFAEKDTTGHGTHGLSIAAGDDAVKPGLAPAADIVVVKATRRDGTLSFDSGDLVSAVQFVKDKATELSLPFVINLSLGTIFSSHDGRSLEEEVIDDMVGPGKPGRAIVVAAGNSSANGTTKYHHFTGTTYVGIPVTHTLTVPSYTAQPGSRNDSLTLSLWYKGRDKHKIKVTPPTGFGCTTMEVLYGAPPPSNTQTGCGDVLILNLGGANALNGDTQAFIQIDDWESGTAPQAGTWTIEVTAQEIGDTGEYHGWIVDSALGDLSQEAYLSANADNNYLVGKPGTAFNAITVGSFASNAGGRYLLSWTDVGGNPRSDGATPDAISDFSSPGKTRDGRVKPDVTAPGERVLGAVSQDAYPSTCPAPPQLPRSIYCLRPTAWISEGLITENTPQHAYGALQGTSFAAPVVTGLVARILSTNPNLDAIQVRNILINSATADGFTGAVPNDLWGYGKVDLSVGTTTLPSDLRIKEDTLPNPVVGKAYGQVLNALGGTAPYTWSVSVGPLPAGLALNGSVLSGVPTTAGLVTFTIQLTDSSIPAQTATKQYTVTVLANGQLRIVTSALPVARVGVTYQESLEAEGVVGTATWTVDAGSSLPSGLSLSPAGVITGMPATLALAGVFFTVKVADSTAPGLPAYRSLRIKVLGPGGSEWNPLGKDAATIRSIAYDPNNANRLVAATNTTVFESLNGGDSWSPISVNNGLSIDLAKSIKINPVDATPWLHARSTTSSAFQPDFPLWTYRGGAWPRLPFGGSITKVVGFDFMADGSAAFSITGLVFRVQGSNLAGYTGISQDCRDGVGLDFYPSPYAGSLAISPSNPNQWWTTQADTNPTHNRICMSQSAGSTFSSWVNLTGSPADGLGVDLSVASSNAFDVVTAGYNYARVSWLENQTNWHPAVLPSQATSGPTCCLTRASTNPAFVLFGTASGLFESDDSGHVFSTLALKGQNPNVTALAINPADALRFFVATTEGVYEGVRQVSGATTWRPRNSGLQRRVLGGLSLASNATSLLISAAEGPYLSRTGGTRWTFSTNGISSTDLAASSALVLPADSNVMLVGSLDGVYRSTSAGLSWIKWTDPTTGSGDQVVALTADPTATTASTSAVIVALTGTSIKGLYRSADGGVTWTGANSGLAVNHPKDVSFAADGNAYAGVTASGVSRSTDKGASWSAFGLAGLTVNAVRAAPSSPAYLYAGTSAGTAYFCASPCTGTWTAATTSPARPLLSIAVHPTNHLIAWAGADHPGTAGNTGGVYKTTDGGANWTRLAGVMDSYDVVGLVTHPTDGSIVYAATREGGAFKSEDGGTTWKELAEYGTIADFTNTAIADPNNAQRLLAGTDGFGVQVSTDGGKTFAPAVTGLGNLTVNAIAFDAAVPTTVFAGTDQGLYKSTDSGNTWAPVNPGSITGRVSDVLTTKTDGPGGTTREIWATVQGQGVAYSNDGGVNFTVSADGLVSLELTSLDIDNTGTTREIWATTRGGDGVVYSDDNGAHWKSAAGNGLGSRDVNDVKVQKGSTRVIWATTRVIWATTDGGVYYSLNGGQQWTDLNLGLPSGVPVSSAAIDPKTDELLVSLNSGAEGGVYRGANIRGIWSSFSDGLEELKVRRLTNDGGRNIDASTTATTFFAATAGAGVFSNEVRSQSATPSVSTTSLPDGDIRTTYSGALAATGGTTPYSWSIGNGFLPPGLNLNASTGAITGTPGQVGTYTFTAQVTDANQQTGKKDFNIAVLDPREPTLTIGNASAAEGNGANTTLSFPVTLNVAASQIVTVNYATSNGTATAGVDYQATSGTLTFLVGETSKNVAVTVFADLLNEADETVTLSLTSPSGVQVANGTATGTILNDDALPALAISDAVPVTEGNSGSVSASFTVTLAPASGQPVSVNYATADGTATAGSDFTSTGGTLTFNPGETTKTVSITVFGDTAREPNETFVVNLSGGVNASVADGQGVGTITNDDPLPSITIADSSTTEGNAGTTSVSFSVLLSNPSSQTVSVDYSTADNTATLADNDYVAKAGTLSIPPGSTSATIAVTVNGDTNPEPNETFFLNLTVPVNATIADNQAVGTIVTDEAPPTLSISSNAITEGNSGTQTISLSVTLSPTSASTVSVNYATADGTATVAGNDYVAQSNTLTFTPGQNSKTITLAVNGDLLNETTETFVVNLTNPIGGGAVIGTGQATVTIFNDDAQPSIAIADLSVSEASANANVVVSLSAASGQTVTVGYATANGTALSGFDYSSATGTVTFPPGSTTQTIAVPLTGDTLNEDDETVLVNLSGATNATIADNQAQVTILDDDPLPTLSVDDVSVIEGNSIGPNAVFTVSLSAPSGRAIAVNYATSNGTASAGADYAATSGTLSFSPGATSRTVTVPVNADTAPESNETFNVSLSSPSNATIADGLGIGTILDDDTQTPGAITSPAPPGPLTTTPATLTWSAGTGAAEYWLWVSRTLGGSEIYDASQGTGLSRSVAIAIDGRPVYVRLWTRFGGTWVSTDYAYTTSTPASAKAQITSPTVGPISAPVTLTWSAGTGVSQYWLSVGTSPGGTDIYDASQGASLTRSVATGIPTDGRSVYVRLWSLMGTSWLYNDYSYTTAAPAYAKAQITSPAAGPISAPVTFTWSSGTNVSQYWLYVGTTLGGSEIYDASQGIALTRTLASGIPNDGRTVYVRLWSLLGTAWQFNDYSYATGAVVLPTLTINDPAGVTEGDSGTTTITFTVTLSAASASTVTVSYATADGTAAAPSDYASTSGTLTFTPGQTSQTIPVTVTGDTTVEANETLVMNLTSPANATIADGTGVGMILNDDSSGGLPTLSIDDPSANEGNAGTSALTFTVSLSAASASTVTVDYATANDTATAGSDYMAASGTLTFSPGQVSKTIAVTASGDTAIEPNETFKMNLTNPTNATILDGQGVGTIRTDDPLSCPVTLAPNASFSSVVSGGSSATDWVALAVQGAANTSWISYKYATLPRPSSVSFTAPTTVGNYELRLFANDTYTLLGSCSFIVSTGPVLTINDVSLAEGNAGPVTASFTVTLTPTSGGAVTVDYATANGTATAGSDYVSTSGTLTFAAGQSTQTITVTVNGDTATEGNETYLVNLSNPTGGATIGDGQGIGTITNDDGPLACPANVAAGASFSASVTGGSSITDWIGMFPAAQVANSPFLQWKYVPLPRPASVSFTGPASPGSYQLRLFANDGYTLLGTCAFSVP